MIRKRRIAIALVGLPAVMLLGAWIGIYNVAASTGHWAITDWFLHFAMRSSVRTYSIGVEVPPLDDPALLQPAAGHYERGCAPCHGAPDRPRPPSVLSMLPVPPDVRPRVATWDDAELFRIVKHGVRFTGMPAWPVQSRDDEVWAMVAFLRALPNLDAAAYRQLAFGAAADPGPLPPDPFERALDGCARCHGHDGRGRSEHVPIIAGQSAAYMRESLAAFADRNRASGVMALAAADADPSHWDALARHYATQERHQSSASATGDHARGREIALRGLPERKVPACLGCHEAAGRNPMYPALSGQHAIYLEAQLRLFAAGIRGGTQYRHLMSTVARSLTPRDMRDLAAYFSARPAAP